MSLTRYLSVNSVFWYFDLILGNLILVGIQVVVAIIFMIKAAIDFANYNPKDNEKCKFKCFKM